MLLKFDSSAAYNQDLEGKTALYIAAWKGHEKIMRDIILECPECCELVATEAAMFIILPL